MTRMYAMEDFCQLSFRMTQDKYLGSYEKCAKIIIHYSEFIGLDLSELFMRVLFSFITGNSDMHLKNFSLKEQEPGKRHFVLSEAYDMLPVNVILPSDQDELALTLNGKKRNIRKKDFLIFAEKCRLSPRTAERIISHMCNQKESFLEECDRSYLTEHKKKQVKDLIELRIARLH